MIYSVLKVSNVLRDEHGDPMRNITLGEVNEKSDNRYYVSISGLNANLIDWTKVTQVKVECFCKAYLQDGAWHSTIGSSTMSELKGVEISTD